MSTYFAFALCVGSGVIGGVFFAFSTFVMKALAELPAEQGAEAMRRINVVVLNAWFLGVFMGTAVVAIGCIATAFLPWIPARSPLLVAAAVLYLAGTFVVTIVFNVPRNKRLARLLEGSRDGVDYWPEYVKEWTFWNHVRTIASIAAAASSAAALAV